jgi:hypothetical protein
MFFLLYILKEFGKSKLLSGNSFEKNHKLIKITFITNIAEVIDFAGGHFLQQTKIRKQSSKI